MSYANPWIYQGKHFNSENIGDFDSFVYIITNKLNDKQYIGKKSFFSKKKVHSLKRRKQVESDWKKYYGSCLPLQEDVKQFGLENFHREILHLCETKGKATFMEVKEQFSRGVLQTDENLFYNKAIGKWRIRYPQTTELLQ